LESRIDSAHYGTIARCVRFVEDQVTQFDDRNETEFSQEFAPLIQEAFIVIIVAQMEHHLKKVCDILAELRNMSVHTTDLRGANGFESCIAYLKNVLQIPIPDNQLKQVRAIVRIRNALVHQGGYIEGMPADLGALHRHVRQGGDGRLEFPGAFAEEAAAVCKALVVTVEEVARSQSATWAQRKKRQGLKKK
jgi:hypothetical protein